MTTNANSANTPKKKGPGRPKAGNALLKELLKKFDLQLAADYPAIYKAIKGHALAGDAACARLLMDRAHPARKSRPSPITIPLVKTMADARDAIGLITHAVGTGELTLDEADSLCRMVTAAKNVIETTETEQLQKQIEELEAGRRTHRTTEPLAQHHSNRGRCVIRATGYR